MGFLRKNSCYRAKVKFFTDSETETEITWYPAEPGAKWFPLYNIFAESVRMSTKPQDWSRLGEVPDTRSYVKNFINPVYPGTCYRGTAQQWAHGFPISDLDHIPPHPECCRPMFPYKAKGKVILGGSMPLWLVSTGFIAFKGSAPKVFILHYRPIGKLLLRGTAPAALREAYRPLGGLRMLGTAPAALIEAYRPLGGLRLLGSVPISVSYPDSATGELLLRGTASVAFREAYVPSGGLRLLGSAPAAERLDWTPLGGLRLGGVAPGAEILYFVPSGHLKIQGSSTVIEILSVSATGELILEGGTTTDEIIEYDTSGELILGGAATGEMVTGPSPPPLGPCGNCAAGHTPAQFQMTVAGFVSPNNIYNGTWILDQQIEACHWFYFVASGHFSFQQFTTGAGIGNVVTNTGGFCEFIFTPFDCTGFQTSSLDTNNMGGSPTATIQPVT